MAITVKYTTSVFGHPEKGSVVTVERTSLLDGMLAAGYAVIVEPAEGEDPEPG